MWKTLDIDNKEVQGIETFLTGVYGTRIKDGSPKPGRLVVLKREPDVVFRYNGNPRPDDILRKTEYGWERYLGNNDWEQINFEDLPSFRRTLDIFYTDTRRLYRN